LPLVSIILPVFNAEKYLSAALASILLQDHHDIEVIAINDGSTDGSINILRRAALHDSRLVLIERENRGLIATLNEGIERGSGDFIARMDADDISYPERISTQLRMFNADPDLALSGCFFDTIYSRGRVLPKGVATATGTTDLRVLSRFCTILRHPTVMFRRSTIPEGMLHYDEAYPCAEDFDLFRRIADRCKVSQTAEPLLAYRLHENSVSVTRMATMIRSHVTIVEEGLRRFYPFAAGTGFPQIADEVSPASITCAAELIRRLDTLLPLQPKTERHAFQIATIGTFYFLFSLICHSKDYSLACAFVEQSGHWDRIRRRERPILRAARLSPLLGRIGYAAFGKNLEIVRALTSRDIRKVVPAHDTITALAATYASVSRQACMVLPNA